MFRELGKANVVQDGATAPCYDADFYPFGGEQVVANACPQNYKFEGKERDAETGNDDFGAPYYSSRFGRWLSADWSAVPAPVPYANLTNPQTLNLYAMVSDNPEILISKQESRLQNTARLVHIQASETEGVARRRAGCVNDRKLSTNEKCVLVVGRGQRQSKRAAARAIEQIDGSARDASRSRDVLRPHRQGHSILAIVSEQDSA